MADIMDRMTAKAEIIADLRKQKEVAKAVLDAKKADFNATIIKDVELLNGLAAKIKEYQEFMLEVLREKNLTQWKTTHATITRKFNPDKFVIRDKNQLLVELAEKDLAAEYTYTEFKPEVKTLFGQVEFKSVEKVTGEDYISVSVKKDEKKEETK